MNKYSPVYLLITLFCGSFCQSQDDLETFHRIIKKNPQTRLSLLDGRIQLVDIYKLQITSLYESQQEKEADRIAQYADDVYSPCQEFWNNFFSDKEGFTKWARKYWQKIQNIKSPGYRIPFEVNFDSLFTATVSKIKTLTSREPHGTWYLALATWPRTSAVSMGAICLSISLELVMMVRRN